MGQPQPPSVRVAQFRADAVTLIDEAGTVLIFDAMAERLFGWRAAEIVGRNVVTLMPPEYRSQRVELSRRHRSSERGAALRQSEHLLR